VENPDIRFDEEDKPREACGVVAVYGVPQAAQVMYAALFSLQHRGQESAGMVVSEDGRMRHHKAMGLVSEVFRPGFEVGLPGSVGIGHVRYSTTGQPCPQNVQPLLAECRDGGWAIAHNGNLVNARALRDKYQRGGAIFQTSTDSEILLHQLADPRYFDLSNRVAAGLSALEGSFAFVFLNRDRILAARDPWGIRPLSIGRLGEGYVVASETCALAQIGATFLRDVEPGELVTIDAQGIRSARFADSFALSTGQCVFEHIYFARPDSVVFGQSVYTTRVAIGRKLAAEAPVEADMVVPIPDSGMLAALGFSQDSGIPLHLGFIRNHYVGRTFIMPSASDRSSRADLKLAVAPEVVRGKRVVVVDDSIIRGNTCRRRLEALRAAGATEIHLRIACPPTKNPCFFGIDFPSRNELVAAERTVEEIRVLVGADSLAYLSMEGLKSVLDHPGQYCMGCFTGCYPMNPGEVVAKASLEVQ